MATSRANRARQTTRDVREDWVAWLPSEMGGLFDDTRTELEASNIILSVTLDEALALCRIGKYEFARERGTIFAGLFDRLADRLLLVIHTIEGHGARFGTLPHVSALAAVNFRGVTAQRISRSDTLLARLVLPSRSKFFHKLSSLEEIIGQLQVETHRSVHNLEIRFAGSPVRLWKELEILGYDLNTCMGETTVVLKSFFCALPGEQLDSFRRRLTPGSQAPLPIGITSGRITPFRTK